MSTQDIIDAVLRSGVGIGIHFVKKDFKQRIKKMKELNSKHFSNGSVYALETEDSYPIEVTDTFLPYYTKDAIGRRQNSLVNTDFGDRSERWMIGVSCMSGCYVGCKFCATGQLKKSRRLKFSEILSQINFILGKYPEGSPDNAKEFKINYTRMGEPFLNIEAIQDTINYISAYHPTTHHYISTIGIKGSDFSWIQGNISLQISLHSLIEERRNNLIPFGNKMSIEELGQIRTKSNLKTTINLTLVDKEDFDINLLKKYFDPKYFFIKLSPINKNSVSEGNNLGNGIIENLNF
jgi:adenine C2-methylase RlmN of 23S rRNA A2503 and tRNA A37